MATYNWIQIESLNAEQKIDLFEIWNNEYPVKLVYNSFSDFEHYLHQINLNRIYLLMNEDKQIAGWAYTFLIDQEVWFSILIERAQQEKGHGTAMLRILKELEPSLTRWVIDHDMEHRKDGTRYHSPMRYYLKKGFDVIRDQRLEIGLISAVKIKWVKPFSLGSN